MPKKKTIVTKVPSLSSVASCCMVSFCTTFAMFLIALNVFTFLDQQKILGVATTQAGEMSLFEEEKAYWQDIITRYPTYRDGYLELAQIAIDLGNEVDANLYITQARIIDPNSPLVESLAQRLAAQ